MNQRARTCPGCGEVLVYVHHDTGDLYAHQSTGEFLCSPQVREATVALATLDTEHQPKGGDQ